MKSTDRKSQPVKRRGKAKAIMPAPRSSQPAEPIRGRSRRVASQSPSRSQSTDRQPAEEALRESEEKYRNVVERANDGIAIIQDSIVKYLNPRLAELWGGTVAQIIGRPFADYIHPDELPVVLDRYHRRMAGEVVTPTYETALKRKDGSKIYAELNAGTIMFHGQPADLVIVRDITHRKQAENKLAAERNLLSTLIDHLPDNIFVKDADGRIVIDNIAHRRLLGATTLEGVVGKTDFDFFARNLATPYDADEKEIIHSGKPLINREEPTVDGDGQQRWLLTTKLPLRDHQGQITGIVGINRDITERKRAEETVRRRAEELAALQATLLEITASRDLHSLLQTIVERAAQLLGARSGGIYLCDPGRREVSLVVCYNTPRDYSGTVLKYGEGAAGSVAETGEPLIIDDYRVWSKRAAAYEQEQPFTAVLSAPMIWHDQVTGVIEILDEVESRHFAETDLELLSLFANHAAIAVENVRLYDAAQSEITERKQMQQELRASESSLQEILQSTADGILGVNRENKVLYANERFAQMWRIPLAVMVTRDDSVLLQHVLGQLSDPAAFLKKVEDLYQSTEDSLDVLYFKDRRAFERRSRALVQNGELRGRVWSFHDVTERERAEEALRQAEAKYRNIVDNAIEGIYQSTPAGRFFTANVALARMLGYDSPAELIGGVNNLNQEFYVQPGRREEFVRQLGKHGMISNFESQVYRKDGSQIWVSENARAVLGAEEHLHYEGTLVDITERKRAEEALRVAEASYRSLFENSPVGIYQTTPQGRPVAVNQALASIVGYDSPQELLDCIDNVEQQFYVEPAARREFQRQIETQGQVGEFSSQARRRDGGIIWVQESARAVRDAEGGTLYYEGFMTDVTERKQADEELKRLSTHDSLTGLYNRGFFMVEMTRLERGRKFPVSIMMADVDHLKQTNDQEGHDAGDALLKRVAQVLTATFRVEDVVARIGGDEFAVLLPATDAASAEVSLQRVRRVIQENNAAYAETPIHLSLGVSTAENPAPLSAVLKEADANMYRAKRAHNAS